ncbi:hypothetical protein [Alkalihalobacillus trypoxylicola]|uniref:hypothetical protein n=1 Tax=Alkalihalobacillus trypoxylicola TaxID=519424 RepID=UPI000A4A45FB|nr:hypothetical protein [Alkalihalobacillus trypoxylicola]
MNSESGQKEAVYSPEKAPEPGKWSKGEALSTDRASRLVKTVKRKDSIRPKSACTIKSI